jgi:tRNA (guanine37-N1)-methyltransferase
MSDVPRLDLEILTLFPEMFDSFLAASLLGKAIEAGLITVQRTNPRDFAPGKHKSVDDTPYGGGPGMVMRPEPLALAIEQVEATRGRAHRVFLSPSGRVFDQKKAVELLGKGRLMFVCGRYEGMDERVPALFADEVLSIGDYVLSGGEVATMVMVEAISRLLPGVVGCAASTVDESFSLVEGRLEYPQWTRPPTFRDLEVPQVLLSGDHKAIERWRREEALRRTLDRRPDLVARHPLTEDERWLLSGQPKPRR